MKPLVSDALWERIAPLLPPEPPKPKGGRPRLADRAALTGISFVLRSGIPWRLLPAELGASASTCWRRRQAWQAQGVWEGIWRALLADLGRAEQIDWRRAVVDSAALRALLGGRGRAPIPRTGPKPAPSTMPSRMHRGFRGPSA